MTGLIRAGMSMQMSKLKLAFEIILILIYLPLHHVYADQQYQIKTKAGEIYITHHHWKEKSNTNFWIDKKEKSIPTSDIETINDITPKTENPYQVVPENKNKPTEKSDPKSVIIRTNPRHYPSYKFTSPRSSGHSRFFKRR
jgi:hypothetical protein